MASPASSEATAQAARPAVFCPLAATVAAIKGEAQPLISALGMGGTDAEAQSAVQPALFAEMPADDLVGTGQG